jgi:L-amino acid N-acyltransferase YncA
MTPLAAARETDLGRFAAWPDAERIVGNLHRAYAGVALPNDASVALHERLGFREVGTYVEVGRKFSRYWDVRWFERSLP